jgi:hypothetical protein
VPRALAQKVPSFNHVVYVYVWVSQDSDIRNDPKRSEQRRNYVPPLCFPHNIFFLVLYGSLHQQQLFL